MTHHIEIHEDRPVTLESAKLLGTMFTWADQRARRMYVYRYVPTESGPAPVFTRAELAELDGWHQLDANWTRDVEKSLADKPANLVTIDGSEFISE